MPRVHGTMLSAGCAGSYYFQWIAEQYGPVHKHIGLELYLPEPDDLPPWVEWVKSSVSVMEGIDDGSVELVFSGQNFEHLFGDDAVDFLVECHRVLADDGWLVMDSPHRDIAAGLGWTMPEHTIEFTPDEARELATLAGFDVTAVRGVWLCQESEEDPVLDLWSDDVAGLPTPEIVRRSVLAGASPDRSFIWWLEARRARREPQLVDLQRRHAEIFEVAWPERTQRLRHGVGRLDTDGVDPVVHVDTGTSGYALYGPYMPLSPGQYEVTFRIRAGTGQALTPVDVIATFDVCDGAGTVIVDHELRHQECTPMDWQEVRLAFELEELVWGGQFRVVSTGRCALDVTVKVALEERGTSVAPTRQTPRVTASTPPSGR